MGLGSLERVELLLRIEQAFGTRLDDRVLAEADTVQDLISALGAVNGLPAVPPTRAGVATRAPEIPSSGIADGLPTAQNDSRRVAASRPGRRHENAPDFVEDEGESRGLTFGELFSGAERVAAELAQRGIGRGDIVAIMLADVA